MIEHPATHARDTNSLSNRLFLALSQRWLVWLNLLLGIWVLLPWAAPVLMRIGATGPASLVYLFYAPQCHQLPQRSYFLFGDQLMIPLQDILTAYPTDDPLSLRPFLGTPELGGKVAWSDRMVSFYTPIFLGGLVYALSGKRWQPARWNWRLLLPFVPLAIDGSSHGINDLFRLGFRETNAWLAEPTAHVFAPSFYASDLVGSFNWWMRLLTGLLAGFALSWLVFPYLNKGFAAMERTLVSNEHEAA